MRRSFLWRSMRRITVGSTVACESWSVSPGLTLHDIPLDVALEITEVAIEDEPDGDDVLWEDEEDVLDTASDGEGGVEPCRLRLRLSDSNAVG